MDKVFWICLAGMCPFLVYFCAKFGAYGWYMGKQRFQQDFFRKGKHGN